MKLNQLPIQRKLVLFIVLTTLAVLIGTYLVLFVYENERSEQTTVQDLTTVANIIAGNSTAALIYDDPKLATEIISGLRAEPDITAAALFDRQGKLFAIYQSGTPPAPLPKFPGVDGGRFSLRAFELFQPVRQDDSRVGTLFLRSNLGAMYRRLRVYGWVLAGVLAGGVLLVFYLSHFLQRQISRPIMHLAETARIVTERKDYSVRAVKQSGDELGFVTDAFNAMLAQIQLNLAALGESEERFRVVADSAPVLIWIADTNMQATWFNRYWLNFVGRPLAQEVGERWLENLHPKDWPECMRVYAQARARREYFRIECRLRDHSGEYRWLLNQGTPRHQGGEFIGFIGSCVDITASKEAEARVRKAHDEAVSASRAKDDFLAALSHELRTPLNPILLLATDAASNPQLSPEARADFETVRKNVELEARLIDDLLDLTSITSGKLVLEQQSVDVHAVLRDALATVRAELESKQIELAMSLATETPITQGDPVRLQQVFWNVLKNAVKFTPRQGKITISTARAARTLTIRISDTGIGISPGELPRVFEAFSQGEHAKGGSHRFGGLGLGLAISRKMMELHSGAIRAESEGRNRGSTFVIELPLSVPSGGSPPVPGAAPAPGSGGGGEPGRAGPKARRTILLVEDHVPTRQVLENLLRRRSYRVLSGGSVSEARMIAETETPDLVISDIGLPDGNGYELMAELEQRFHLKGIALTGYGMERDIARSRATGFVFHLTKPVSMQDLDAAIAATAPESPTLNPPRH